jgi:hypothetical protein
MVKQVTFTRFLEIKCPALRAWNQLQFNMNLQETHGEEIASQYFQMLSEDERVNIMCLGTRIAVRGVDFVKKEVMSYNNEG